MKKAFLLTLVPLLGLVGCANNGGGDENSSLPPLSTTSIEESVPDTDTRWNQEARDAMRKNLGMVLPEASYDTFAFKEDVDQYGDPAMWVYCFFEGHTSTTNSSGETGGDKVIQDAISEYIYQLSADNWVVEYNSYYPAYICDYEVGSHGVEMYVLEGAIEGKEALGIYAFTYTVTKENVWPSALIEDVCGKDVPAYVLEDGEKMQSWEQEGDESSDNNPYVGIVVTDVSDPSEIGPRYASICEAAGWTIMVGEGESYDSYLAYKDSLLATPCIYSYYDEEFTAFYIYVLPISARAFMNA